MVEPNEPKKETTRIPVASPPPEGQADPNNEPRDTVRIQLPLREPPPIRVSTEPHAVPKPAIPDMTSPEFFQAPPAPSAPSSPSVMPAPDLPSSGLKKETVRIPLHAVQMKKTQPLIPMPEKAPHGPSIAVAPAEKTPMPLLWLLLGVSALILIIQIWTYLS
jgi:hypothetical protein